MEKGEKMQELEEEVAKCSKRWDGVALLIMSIMGIT